MIDLILTCIESLLVGLFLLVGWSSLFPFFKEYPRAYPTVLGFTLAYLVFLVVKIIWKAVSFRLQPWHGNNSQNNTPNNEITNLINQIETINNHLDHLKLAVEKLNFKLNSIAKIDPPTDIKK